MDPLSLAFLALQVADKSLAVLLIVLQDQPVEERRKAWKDWFDFWAGVKQTIAPGLASLMVVKKDVE